MMKKRNKLVALLLALVLVVTVGGPALASDLGLETILGGEAPPRAGEGFVIPDAGSGSGSASGGSVFSGGGGSVTYASGVGSLSSEQEQLLLDFMNAYYQSLAHLQVQDPGWLFASSAGDNAQFNKTVWETLVGIRAMQSTDLTLTSYSFTLTVRRTYTEGDVLVLHVYEDNALNFAVSPSATARAYEIGHVFRMTNTGGQWKLTQHYQSDSLTDTLFTRTLTGSALSQRQESVLSDARYYTGNRASRGGSPGDVQVDHAYDRSEAVSYARHYVGTRNSNWRNYTNLGGNCQNFVSQALLAGGIPMDSTTPGVWKWYGDTVNNGGGASRRSSSWSGMAAFLTYVRTNQGFGLVAYADAPYYSGEVGDVIHMGASNGYAHTVMITDVVRDRNGNVIDYLICSNTADLRDFPVSAYYYTNQMLIKVYGWNDA